MTIAVDFDGVIHQYSRGWQDGTIYDPPMPGALDGLRTLMTHDAVFIHTTREPEQVMPWLEQHGFDVTIDERCGNCPNGTPEICADCKGSGLLTFWNLREQLLVTNRKLAAVAYLDDRAVRFTTWEQALTDLGAAVVPSAAPQPEPTAVPISRRSLPDRIRYFARELTRRAAAGNEPDLELSGLAMALSVVADEAEQELAKAQQPPAPEPTRDLDITPWLVVHRYRTDHGGRAWCMRCWGHGDCEGALDLDLSSRQYAESKARRHLADHHPEEPAP